MQIKIFNRRDKGVAGLQILLSVVTLLFVIGILIMAYTIAGSEIQDSLISTTGRQVSATLTNITTVSTVNTENSTYPTGVDGTLTGCSLTIDEAFNITPIGKPIGSGNYSVIGCYIYGASLMDVSLNNTQWNITGSWVYTDYDDTAVEVINDTSNALADVIDWFPTFIVITAVVVLILLIVMIIVAVRGTGLMGGA